MVQREVILLVFIAFTGFWTFALSDGTDGSQTDDKTNGGSGGNKDANNLALDALTPLPLDGAGKNNRSPLYQQFNKYIIRYNKQYSSEEEKNARFENYKTNMKKINELNKGTRGNPYGENKFTDVSQKDFKENYTGRKSDPSRQATLPPTGGTRGASQGGSDFGADTADFDWRNLGAPYPPVPDQDKPHSCGSCYAFCCGGLLDILYGYVYGISTYFAKQQLVSCTSGTNQCGGGLVGSSFSYATYTGLCFQSDYPYLSRNENCNYNASTDGRRIVQFTTSQQLLTEPSILAAVPISPVAVGINSETMQHYRGGLICPSDDECPKLVADHCVIIIGFGHGTCYENNQEFPCPFWIVRNSWGSDWGENGHFRICAGFNACGIGLSDVYVAALTKLAAASLTAIKLLFNPLLG